MQIRGKSAHLQPSNLDYLPPRLLGCLARGARVHLGRSQLHRERRILLLQLLELHLAAAGARETAFIA
jgi:hypothetical protein